MGKFDSTTNLFESRYVDNIAIVHLKGQALGSMLKIYPLLVFLVTIIAGIVGGFLAMILAVPLTAIAIQLIGHLRQDGVFFEDGPQHGSTMP